EAVVLTAGNARDLIQAGNAVYRCLLKATNSADRNSYSDAAIGAYQSVIEAELAGIDLDARKSYSSSALGTAHYNIGHVHRIMGRASDSLQALRQAQVLRERLIKQEPDSAPNINALAATLRW